MKTGFVFDLDGTLVDSLPGIAEGLNLALESLGYPRHSEQDIRMMVGKGARELCRSALSASSGNDPARVPDKSIASLLEAFMREYTSTWKHGTMIYPGMEPLLADLQQLGRPLAVLSNKPHVVTEPLVRQLFPHIRFSMIMGYSERFPRKPNPSALLHIVDQWQMTPNKVTMIGDTIHDAETAISADCGLVLVGWGYAIRSELEEVDAPLCDTAEELRNRLLSYEKS